MRSAGKCLLFLGYPHVLKTHQLAIPGTKDDCAIDESDQGACGIS